MRRMLGCVGIVTGIACASPAMATQAQTPQPEAMQKQAAAALGYVAKAGASDLYEIQSSQLARQKARSAEVRSFGEMMIDHHTKTTSKTIAAARDAGLAPPPPALEPKQRKMIEELRGLSGEAFDTAYLQQQRGAHEDALALHSAYAANGDAPALRQSAQAAVPIVRGHLEQVQRLRSR